MHQIASKIKGEMYNAADNINKTIERANRVFDGRNAKRTLSEKDRKDRWDEAYKNGIIPPNIQP